MVSPPSPTSLARAMAWSRMERRVAVPLDMVHKSTTVLFCQWQVVRALRKWLRARLKCQRGELKSLRVHLTCLRAELNCLQVDLKWLRAELNCLQVHLKSLRAHLKSLQAELKSLRVHLTVLRANLYAQRPPVFPRADISASGAIRGQVAQAHA